MEDSGLKGMWNRVRGRGRPSGKELNIDRPQGVKNADAESIAMGMQDLRTGHSDVLAFSAALNSRGSARRTSGYAGFLGPVRPGDKMALSAPFRAGSRGGCQSPFWGAVFRPSGRRPGLGLKKAPERTWAANLAVWL